MQPTHTTATIDVTATTSLDPVTSVSRTLRDTALYLSRHGWNQGEYYDTTATVFAPAACLVGGLGMVCYGGPVDAPALNHDDPGYPEFAAAQDWLDAYLETEFGLCCYGFNDTDGRTAAEILEALEAAAAAWDRHYGPTGPQGPSTMEVTR